MTRGRDHEHEHTDQPNPGEALAALCRAAVARFRVEAFDNVALGSLLSDPEIADDDARWIGRHLMSHASSRDAYVAGQAILRRLPTSRPDQAEEPPDGRGFDRAR